MLQMMASGKGCARCLFHSIIVILAVIFIFGFLASFCAQGIFKSYNNLCILSVSPEFVIREGVQLPDEAVVDDELSNPNVTQLEKNQTTSDLLQTQDFALNATNATTKQEIRHIYRALGKNKILSVDIKSGKRVKTNSKNDANFMKMYKIDELRTNWSMDSNCEYTVCYPLICSIVALIWTVMMFVFRRSKVNTYDWDVPQPWRIVVPSIAIFLIMTIITLTYYSIAVSQFSTFCTELGKNLTATNLSCSSSLSVFQLTTSNVFLLNDAANAYNWFTTITLAILFCWFLALLIMLARCVFVIDFQLVRVNFCETEKKSKTSPVSSFSSSIPSTDSIAKDVHIIKALLKSPDTIDSPLPQRSPEDYSSREDLDDFQSAVSDFELTSFSTNKNRAAQPLLQQSTASDVDEIV